jgi:hypothetical protein
MKERIRSFDPADLLGQLGIEDFLVDTDEKQVTLAEKDWRRVAEWLNQSLVLGVVAFDGRGWRWGIKN